MISNKYEKNQGGNYKKQKCRQFEQGKCSYGQNCKFNHQLCNYQESCKFREKCRFIHKFQNNQKDEDSQFQKKENNIIDNEEQKSINNLFQNLSIQNDQQKIICVDALFITQELINISRWDFKIYVDQIQRFVDAAHNANYKLLIFIDDAIQTKETMKEWQQRRIKEVQNNKKNVMHGFSTILGNIYQKCGAEQIHYSIDDNDDTIAYFANKYEGIIMSGDSDFKMYQPQKYKIFEKFQITDQNQLKLIKKDSGFRKKNKINLQYNYFPSTSEIPLINGIITKFKYTRGVGSSFVQEYGNPHKHFTQMRQALYFKLKIKLNQQILETFPEWDRQKQQAYIYSQNVYPVQNDELINDPYYAIKTLINLDHFKQHKKYIKNLYFVAFEIAYLADPLKKSFLDYCVEFQEKKII